MWVLGGLLILAAALAFVLNALHWTSPAYTPTGANFSVVAGFYVAAQVIERLLELVSPLLPPSWEYDPPLSGVAKAAQIKADRATVILGAATVLGVIGSCLFGLFFLETIGMHVDHTIDAFVTGATIGAGTKPLHDLISLIQNQTTPTTGTGTSA
ncbi:MAG: hypothetical protein QOH12_3373 [Solirubrobacteraceae bacterium]|jgi:hypothetical protein|nr:hypothetical protein [Solirubrobacteraceae bacterium]